MQTKFQVTCLNRTDFAMTDEGNSGGDPEIGDEDLYTLLNLPRDATAEQIKHAYRHFGRIYHPDKHVDPERKREAETLFLKTKYAYEVLTDDVQRAVYDTHGLKSLEKMKGMEQWAVIQRTMTPQEIREQYERLAREQEQLRIYHQTRPRGVIKVQVNATDLFDSSPYDIYDDGWSMEKLKNVEISGMSFHQYIEAPLTTRDRMSLSGEVSTQNKTGSGGLALSISRQLAKLGLISMTVCVGNGPANPFNGIELQLKNSSTFSKHYFYGYEGKNQIDPKGISLNIVSYVGLKLDDHLKGMLIFNGERGISSLSTVLVYQAEKLSLSFGIQLGIPDTNLSLNYSRYFFDEALKLKFSARFGTLGARISYGARTQMTESSTVGATVAVGVPHGVSLTLELTMAHQTYLMPVHMCEDILPAPVFYSSVLPLVGWIVIKKFIVDPMIRDQAEKDKEKQNRLKKKQTEEKKKEAQAAVNLMRAQFERIRTEEESRRGLVIVQAKYGRLISSSESVTSDSWDQSEVIDVTVPLQCLVKDSKLILYEPSKSQLPGFYDPCVGEDKQLLVQYLFHNHMHEITLKDRETLRIPKASHRMSNPS